MKNDGVLKNENLNIPNLSVQEIVQSLAGLYSRSFGDPPALARAKACASLRKSWRNQPASG